MINLWTEKNRLLASYRKDGELLIRDLGLAEYHAFVKDPNALSWDRNILERKLDFDGWTKLTYYDYDTRKMAMESNPGVLYEADVSPVRRFLSDHNCVVDPPKRGYLDIETDSDVPFSQAIEGCARLLSFAVVDEAGHAVHGILSQDTDKDEARVWNELWSAIADFDQICSWGGDRFDFPVLEKRSQNLCRRFRDQFRPFWENRRRLLFVDQYLCFKRHHMAPDSGNDKTSFKLGDVGQALIGEGKDEVPEDLREIVGRGRSMGGSTRKLWDAGGHARLAMLKYNIQDAQLQRKIEEETEYLALQQTIAEVTHTFVNTHGLKPMPFVDGWMLRDANKRKTHLPSKLQPSGEEKEYEGAFVMDTTIQGIMRTVHVCDFKSLYPTVIRTWNLGAETKGIHGCISANGIEFGTEIESMLAGCCRAFMDLREYWTKEKDKHPPGTPAWKAADRKSKAYKIANNSVYGVGGCVWSRIYDVQIVEAITLGAQLLLKATRDAAIERGMVPVAGDTDSLFIGNCSVEEFALFVKWCNSELYPRLLAEHRCNPKFAVIELAYEKCFDRLIVPRGNNGDPASKRYAGSYLHYKRKPGLPVCPPGTPFEPVKYSKPEIKGLEYMRGDSLRATRNMQHEAVMMILSGMEDPEEFEKWVLAKRTAFFTDPVKADDIVKSMGISRDLRLYKTNSPHVRLAKEMQARGEDVGEGTRIGYITVDGKVSPTKVIPVEEFDGTNLDRFHYWQQAIYPATLRVLAGAFPNRNWERWVGRRPKPVLAGQLSLI